MVDYDAGQLPLADENRLAAYRMEKGGMRKIGILGIAVGMLLCYSATSQAASGDGNDLILDCNRTIQQIENGASDSAVMNISFGMCIGEVQGISDAMFALKPGLVSDMPKYCPPPAVPNLQLVRTVVTYLNDHSSELQLPRHLLIMKALYTAYPCKAAK